MSKVIYLDHAAATPLDESVLAAMRPYFSERFYNPSASYGAARSVAKDIAQARGKVAHWLGARSSEIIFTAGGTEANNLAIHGVMQHYPKGNVVVSAIEHDSVLEPAKRYEMRRAPVTPDGLVDLPALEKLIDENTALVSIMYANNEIGTIQPLKQVADLITKKRRERLANSQPPTPHSPLLFHTDACQAAAYLDLHISRLGVDLLTLNGGKIYGPKQAGALYVRAGTVLNPQILGGGQERGMRSGTENVANIIGLSEALDLVQQHRHAESERLQTLQKLFFELLAQAMPTSSINGSLRHRLPANVHVTIPGTNNERLLIELDQAGILAAAGSACSAGRDETSHVLNAIGLSDDLAQASLRLSVGHGTKETDIRRTVEVLSRIVGD